MASTIELYRALREKLEETFPNILIQQKDIKNITFPSFYIQYIGKNLEQTALEYFEDRISFNIIYFAEKAELLELLEVEEALNLAFCTSLSVLDNGKLIEIEKQNSESTINEEDYFLNFTIDFLLTQRNKKDISGEDMEYIEF